MCLDATDWHLQSSQSQSAIHSPWCSLAAPTSAEVRHSAKAVSTIHIKVYLESEILKHATRKFSEGDLNYLQILATRQIPVNTAAWAELWKTATLTYAPLNA